MAEEGFGAEFREWAGKKVKNRRVRHAGLARHSFNLDFLNVQQQFPALSGVTELVMPPETNKRLVNPFEVVVCGERLCSLVLILNESQDIFQISEQIANVDSELVFSKRKIAALDASVSGRDAVVMGMHVSMSNLPSPRSSRSRLIL